MKILLLILLLLTSFVFTEVEQGNLIVEKDILVTTLPHTEEEFTILYTLYNVGNGPVYDVRLQDSENFPKGKYSTVLSQIDTNWDKIEAESNATHAVILKRHSVGSDFLGPAKVLFKNTPNGQDITSTSTYIGRLNFTPKSPGESRKSPNWEHWIIFSVVAALVLIVPFLLFKKSEKKKKRLTMNLRKKK
ncbi:translocon-associated protein beta subunit precursor trap-beta signal sequence receptor beta subunit [Anaeramoeba flamelloides]|uniref:Translocon-associated protein beta subunit trap-beta signal sequence receptor beta subunit n=1 Tax=Anaeramoeba flamelloides TaxID=1746091 RepID=A0AAV7Y7E1_9EUKA|nr:translocon-associated protein beta subunit precursor trap-beta signal sequence receptor beta subunit [Anaeramoeba flamelloides]